MEYKGYEYSVLQSISPRGWIWNVTDGLRTRKGFEGDRHAASRKAQKAISDLIKTRDAAYTKVLAGK
jgi:hypothetical protein